MVLLYFFPLFFFPPHLLVFDGHHNNATGKLGVWLGSREASDSCTNYEHGRKEGTRSPQMYSSVFFIAVLSVSPEIPNESE